MAKSNKSKNAIDKEIMFSKIMPSSLIKSQPIQENENNEKNNFQQTTLSKSTISNPVISNSMDITSKIENDVNSNTIINQKVKFVKQRSVIMINIMEKLVANRLDMAFNKFNCCKCDKCRLDVAALALNKIKPKYVIIEESELDEYITKQDDSEVMPAIIQAMLTVMSKPRH